MARNEPATPTRELAWGLVRTGLTILYAIGWFTLLTWLQERFPFLVAYILSVIPGLLFLAIALAMHEGGRRRLRRRLREQEFRG